MENEVGGRGKFLLFPRARARSGRERDTYPGHCVSSVKGSRVAWEEKGRGR